MNLFGDLPGFAGGPIVPVPATPASTPDLDETAPAVEDFEVCGDIRDHSWDELPIARPGHRTSLWGNPEYAAALRGPLSATDPVIGAEPATEAGTACLEKHVTYHEIEKHSTAEYSATLTIDIKARP
ncbi:hypothetical protein [Nocardia niigatensis]|uniref:hypothetical protein n=1 Tax=Nocardia niigatensis TaxID=209249 RepID=UPI00031242A4|nr:hypothetical protein [Nocardia niigatensis]